MGQVSFPSTGVSSYSMRVGVIGPVSANTQRQFSFYFKSFAGLVVTLPVDLHDFKATTNHDELKLTWVSSKEDNFSHYEVYRSYNGVGFELLGSVNKAVSRSGVNAYQYTDYNALNTTLGSPFYRLKMVDLDGKSAWSHILYIGASELPISAQFGIYPNPNTGVMNIMSVDEDEFERLLIKDIYGKIVFEEELNQTLAMHEVNTSNLLSGVYVLMLLKPDGTVQSTSFVKQ